MISSDTLTIQDVGDFHYSNEDGYFFIYNTDSNQVGMYRQCREEFNVFFTNESRYIGFTCTGLDINKLNNFFQIIEDKLGLDEEDRTTFYPVKNWPHVVILQLPDFWLNSINCRAFLTLFLRCGAVYFRGTRTFENTLNVYNLSSGMLAAVELFLEGYTLNALEKKGNFNGGQCGIYKFFCGKTKEQMLDFLFKKLIDEVSLGAIWKKQNA